jgi:FAD/FMN-containing dehydrogenase
MPNRPETALRVLRDRLSGTLVTAQDDGYDQARSVWNAMIERRPAAIVRAAGLNDVVATIATAREHDLDLAVRGGGHNVAGNGTVDGGVVLDLGDLRAVTVEAASRTVRVEGGATLAGVDAATEPYGLAVPLGVISGTGVGGLTLGGGIGWLTRPYGLAAEAATSGSSPRSPSVRIRWGRRSSPGTSSTARRTGAGPGGPSTGGPVNCPRR